MFLRLWFITAVGVYLIALCISVGTGELRYEIRLNGKYPEIIKKCHVKLVRFPMFCDSAEAGWSVQALEILYIPQGRSETR